MWWFGGTVIGVPILVLLWRSTISRFHHTRLPDERDDQEFEPLPTERTDPRRTIAGKRVMGRSVDMDDLADEEPF